MLLSIFLGMLIVLPNCCLFVYIRNCIKWLNFPWLFVCCYSFSNLPIYIMAVYISLCCSFHELIVLCIYVLLYIYEECVSLLSDLYAFRNFLKNFLYREMPIFRDVHCFIYLPRSLLYCKCKYRHESLISIEVVDYLLLVLDLMSVLIGHTWSDIPVISIKSFFLSIFKISL